MTGCRLHQQVKDAVGDNWREYRVNEETRKYPGEAAAIINTVKQIALVLARRVTEGHRLERDLIRILEVSAVSALAKDSTVILDVFKVLPHEIA